MKTKILFGTPCYGGMMHTRYFMSVLRILPELDKMGIEYTFALPSSESLIPRARNKVVAEFIGRKDCTHLLFIDADINLNAEYTRLLS